MNVADDNGQHLSPRVGLQAAGAAILLSTATSTRIRENADALRLPCSNRPPVFEASDLFFRPRCEILPCEELRTYAFSWVGYDVNQVGFIGPSDAGQGVADVGKTQARVGAPSLGP